MTDTAGVLVCGACGGPVVRTAKACAYCGTAVVLPVDRASDDRASFRTYCPRCATLYPWSADRCPRCPPGDPSARGGRCPRCAAGLQPTAMGTVTVDVCPECAGRWFDGGEIERVVDLATQGVSRDEAKTLRANLPAPAGPAEEVRYVACVRCGDRMWRRQVAVRAGIIIDICRLHGLWFDGGEFERFEEFVKAGGLEVLRQDAAAPASPIRDASGRTSRFEGRDLAADEVSGGLALGVFRALAGLSFHFRRWR